MLRPHPIVSSLTFAAGLVLSVAACEPTVAPTPSALPGPAAPTGPTGRQAEVDPNRPVLVALLAPKTSPDRNAAAIGNALTNAGLMAMVDLADPTMEIRSYDTGGTVEGARSAAERAVADGAGLILGPLFGANTPAVGEVAGRAGINVISFSTDSGVAGGPVFLSGFLPEAEAARVVGFATSRGRNRIAVFYPQSDYGNTALEAAQRTAGSLGARIVVASGYPRTFQGIQNTAGSFASAALSAGADAVLLPDGGQGLRSAGAFLDYGGLDPVEVKYLGLGQWSGNTTLEEAALKGGWFPAPDPGQFDTFAGVYANRYGERPPLVAVLGYDAVQVAGQLLADARRSGSRTPFGRAEITRPEGFDGILGPLRFRSDGLNQRAMAILEVRESGFEVVDPAPSRLDLGL